MAGCSRDDACAAIVQCVGGACKDRADDAANFVRFVYMCVCVLQEVGYSPGTIAPIYYYQWSALTHTHTQSGEKLSRSKRSSHSSSPILIRSRKPRPVKQLTARSTLFHSLVIYIRMCLYHLWQRRTPAEIVRSGFREILLPSHTCIYMYIRYKFSSLAWAHVRRG